MSLQLLQGYSSAEEEEEEEEPQYHNSSDEDGDGDGIVSNSRSIGNKPLVDLPDPNPSSLSSLPSAFDAFSQVAGPPQFLNNSVEETAAAIETDVPRWRHGHRNRRDKKKDLPAGAVMEAKAQLVGIHERVRSDVDGNLSSTTPIQPSSSARATSDGSKRIAVATNPNAEDAAELLRMCVRCGIPKTYSNARGMVCPVCGDRPSVDADKEPAKKKGSNIKEKEKSKRMRGQSSHATWKSETEMQLRQQFD